MIKRDSKNRKKQTLTLPGDTIRLATFLGLVELGYVDQDMLNEYNNGAPVRISSVPRDMLSDVVMIESQMPDVRDFPDELLVKC